MASKKKNKKSKFRSKKGGTSVYDAIHDDSMTPTRFDDQGRIMYKAISPKKEDKIDFFKSMGLVKTAQKGGKVKGYKKGGPITYRMTGGQVVDNSYD